MADLKFIKTILYNLPFILIYIVLMIWSYAKPTHTMQVQSDTNQNIKIPNYTSLHTSNIVQCVSISHQLIPCQLQFPTH